MSIKQEASGFFEWHDQPQSVPSLGIESARLDECIARYHEFGFRGLFGSPHFGFEQDNLDFLAGTANATRLWFWDVALVNIDALYQLADLQYVGINPKRPGIEFSRFPALETAINHWLKADTGISASTISDYHLWHFKPRSKSFAELEIPRGVRELHLYWANPATLDGLPTLKRLRELQIHRCRNLSNLSALPRIAPKLRKLLITNCPRIDTSAGIHDHPSLKTALISGNELLAIE